MWWGLHHFWYKIAAIRYAITKVYFNTFSKSFKLKVLKLYPFEHLGLVTNYVFTRHPLQRTFESNIVSTLCSRNFQNVKLRLCWNLIILPTLGFYVKSNFAELKRSINVIFGNFKDSELWILINFGIESFSNLLKIKLRTSKIAKNVILKSWIRQNLILRKIWVAVRLSRINITFWKFLEHSAVSSLSW